jgi:hypothetical protein
MVTLRGHAMAIRLDTLRVFDTLVDAIETAKELERNIRTGARVFMVGNDKRAKEIDWRNV